MLSSHPRSTRTETHAMRLATDSLTSPRLPGGRRAWIVPFAALALFVAAILALLTLFGVRQGAFPFLAGAGSEATRHLFTPVARGVVLLVPQPGRQMQVFADMLKKIDDITEAREARLESAQIALPSEYWHAVGLIILILASLMSLVEITGFRAVAMGLQLSSLAIILALVFITDRPYLGETSIGPDAFQHVLKLMLERTS